ncbi:cytochrome P450 [Mangrovimicrobium sediminis]|uniref:Cytochrome P450 n=1 Tax=Mangrovimicrobium sediminis TaxID=2562682 RepID=A0A4Z0M1H5_9GAMM|nr:cytochrome P450 [Haliea sp. SAOS-164]TGD73391.1 cytochrome P450 [Haliea sp. SAOS-164]
MQAIADLDLAHLPMETPEFSADPLPYFAAARDKHPWLAQCLFGHVIHEYEAMKDLLMMDEFMAPAQEMVVQIMQAEGTPWGRLASNVLLAQTGDNHRRQRQVLTPLFSPRQAKLSRELMRGTIRQLLDEWAPRGEFDFEAFISLYPIGVMCAMLGSPREALPGLRQSLETLGLSMSMDPDLLPALQEATNHIDTFGQQLVAARRAGERPAQGGELLDILVDALDAGGLDERELYDLLIFLFVGGYDTSKNVLTLLMFEMLRYPDIYVRCAEDEAYCGKVVEEAMRFHGVANIPRMTTQDLDYRGVRIPAGSMLFIPASLAGRDPGAFGEADRFDPERAQQNRHLGFGRGMHICLGQHIARAQMEVGLHEVAKRLRQPRLADADLAWRPFFGVWGLQGLPIWFEDAGPA